MAFNNLENRHFSEQEITEIRALFNQMKTLLEPKLANLTPEERSQHGSINEQNKLIVNKVRDFHEGDPDLCSPDIDWTEFENDYRSRTFLEQIIAQLSKLADGMSNAKILHDSDNYKAALIDYDYSKYKHNAGVPGYKTKVKEIQQFFSRTGRRTNAQEENTTDDNTTVE